MALLWIAIAFTIYVVYQLVREARVLSRSERVSLVKLCILIVFLILCILSSILLYWQ